jgi:hypothetical protein
LKNKMKIFVLIGGIIYMEKWSPRVLIRNYTKYF